MLFENSLNWASISNEPDHDDDTSWRSQQVEKYLELFFFFLFYFRQWSNSSSFFILFVDPLAKLAIKMMLHSRTYLLPSHFLLLTRNQRIIIKTLSSYILLQQSRWSFSISTVDIFTAFCQRLQGMKEEEKRISESLEENVSFLFMGTEQL